MRYLVVDSTEYTYPDMFSYATGKDSACVKAARGGYASFQIVLKDVEKEELPVSVEGADAELYALYPVPVERNFGLDETNERPHMPERKAPYLVYDALMPYRGKVKVTDGAAGLYVAIPTARDAEPGEYEAAVKVGDCTVPVKVTVSRAVVPEETLKIIQGYVRNFEIFHDAKPGTEEFERLDREYVAKLRRMHQNMVYMGGVTAEKVGENRWTFDFSEMEMNMEKALAAGIRYFNGPSVGHRKSWTASTILLNNRTIPAMSYEGYCYLTQYLPSLRDFLKEHGWLDRFVMGVADEPNEENCTEYRALCGLIRKIVPEIRLIDAMSYGDLHGALDIWVPLNREYDQHRAEMETLRGNGDEIWQYVCCFPRGDGFINRFMDYALLCTRYMFWGNFKYNLTGYLHWATNNFQQGISKIDEGVPYLQDPFTYNCPEHHNTDSVCYLPAGDTHLLYPGGYKGNGEVQEPWLSMRAESQRESAEEYEMLKALAEKEPDTAKEICARVFRSFSDVEFDVKKFAEAREALLEAWGKYC